MFLCQCELFVQPYRNLCFRRNCNGNNCFRNFLLCIQQQHVFFKFKFKSTKWSFYGIQVKLQQSEKNKNCLYWLNFILFSVNFPSKWSKLLSPYKELKKKTTNLSFFKNEKSGMHWHCRFQVIISLAFPYRRPIALDWFPWETCQFSFIFQFTTASLPGRSPLWNQKQAVFFTTALNPNCKPELAPPNQPCDALIWTGNVAT